MITKYILAVYLLSASYCNEEKDEKFMEYHWDETEWVDDENDYGGKAEETLIDSEKEREKSYSGVTDDDWKDALPGNNPKEGESIDTKWTKLDDGWAWDRNSTFNSSIDNNRLSTSNGDLRRWDTNYMGSSNSKSSTRDNDQEDERTWQSSFDSKPGYSSTRSNYRNWRSGYGSTGSDFSRGGRSFGGDRRYLGGGGGYGGRDSYGYNRDSYSGSSLGGRSYGSTGSNSWLTPSAWTSNSYGGGSMRNIEECYNCLPHHELQQGRGYGLACEDFDYSQRFVVPCRGAGSTCVKISVYGSDTRRCTQGGGSGYDGCRWAGNAYVCHCRYNLCNHATTTAALPETHAVALLLLILLMMTTIG